jgi:hypothetical protein
MHGVLRVTLVTGSKQGVPPSRGKWGQLAVSLYKLRPKNDMVGLSMFYQLPGQFRFACLRLLSRLDFCRHDLDFRT